MALLLVAALGLGCVSRQRREMVEAREAHRACVDSHPLDAERACAELEAKARALEEQYENDALRSWGCGEGSGPCDPRDRARPIER